MTYLPCSLLVVMLGVPKRTLLRWAKEDGWQTRGEGNSITYDAEQASESYHRRRVA